MAFIGESRKDNDKPWDMFVCLDLQEAKLLQRVVNKEYNRIERLYEKYKDMHDYGEPTEKQVDKMFEYDEQAEALRSVVDSLKSFIQNYS